MKLKWTSKEQDAWIGIAVSGNDYALFRVEKNGHLYISGTMIKKRMESKPAMLSSMAQAIRIAEGVAAELEGGK